MFINPGRWDIMNNFIQKFKNLVNLGGSKHFAKNVFDDILFQLERYELIKTSLHLAI